MRREKKKKGERESRGISATLLPKFLCPKSVKEKAIAATPLPKKEKKKFVLAIVAMPLPKMKKKNYEICE